MVAEYCDMSISVCSSVRISQEQHGRSLSYFLCMLPLVVAQSSSGGVVLHYILPVLWMTSHFHNGRYSGMSLPLQRRCCSVVYRLVPLLRGIDCIVSIVQGVPGIVFDVYLVLYASKI